MEKAKLLRQGTSGDINFSYWKLSEVLELCNIGTEAAVNAPLVEVPTDHLELLSHEAALRVCKTVENYCVPWLT